MKSEDGQPIRRDANGGIDIAYYLQRARRMRAEAVWDWLRKAAPASCLGPEAIIKDSDKNIEPFAS
ncbi:MAG: hypothetical protein D6758_07235 [Gammaproteobacteria bacterium]|nr:MAG: hypothetical protein D6758_07235 [Gammaproteobacteria bacterium]